jgi:hypothetical protein
LTRIYAYQYIKWLKAIEENDSQNKLDDKFYTIETAKQLLEDTGYSNSDEILNLLGVSSNSSGFYIGKREIVICNQIINTRDENSVKSADV